MRKFIWIVVILAVAGLAAAVTRPSAADVEAALKARFLDKLATINPSAQKDGGGFALSLMCKADQDACWKVVRAGLDVTYEDRRLYAQVGIEGFGRQVTCYGLFTRVFCAGDIPMGES